LNAPAHQFAWAATHEEWSQAADFFARVIAADPAYISHGEIQTGLSLDGTTWAPDLAQRFLNELGAFDQSRSVALGRDGEGNVTAAANISWSVETPEVPFATLQDMAVEPALRGSGIGAALLAFVEAEARARGMKWLFLESGKANTRAHAFFERFGLREVSHVFGKRFE
jgi:GNAT superfamily N-acetyltransferase